MKAAFTLVTVPSLFFLAGAAPPAKLSPAMQEYSALVADFRREETRVIHASQDAATDVERQKIMDRDMPPLLRRQAARMIEFAGNHAADRQAAFAALSWAATAPDFACPEQDQALNLLIGGFVQSDNVTGLCRKLAFSASPRAEVFLKEVWEKNPAPEVRAQGGYYLARYWHEQSKGGSERRAANTGLEAKAEKLFSELAATHAWVKLTASAAPETLGQAIENDLFEIHHLGVGRPAPEIVGVDIEGKPFRLSDYRGKVVLLDFWGHWCGDCRALYPHERLLINRLAGKPFVLLGVNSDANKDTLGKAISKEKITWRSWWDDGSRRGPISTHWNVHAWPTIYVIDAQGVIRYKDAQDVRVGDIDETIEKLLAKTP